MTAQPTGDAKDMLLSRIAPDGDGIEVGVWRGDFSARILQRCAPRRLTLIDPWRVNLKPEYSRAWYGERTSQATMDGNHAFVLDRFQDEIARGAVRVDRRPSAEALADMPQESADFIYVDGDHTYDSVLSDLRLGYRVLKTGGLLCGDDYWLGGWWGDGVVRALHQAASEMKVLIEMIQDAQYVLRKLG